MRDVKTRDVLLAEQVSGLRLLLVENRDEHVGWSDFLATARLHVEDGALQDALEPERRLHVDFRALLECKRGVESR